MKVYVYPSDDGWAAFQALITAIGLLGYKTEHWRQDGRSYAEITG